jgi:hypothetical protein
METSYEEAHSNLEEMSVQLRMKEHVVDVLQAKMSELERELDKRDARIQEMRVKERMYEELDGKYRKREEMLRQRTLECEKVRGMLDKKDVEIGELRKDLKELSATPNSPGSQLTKLKDENMKLEGANKGHIRELKMLRSIAKSKVSEVAKEGGGALQSAVSKLKEMEEEMEKVRRMVQEGEKLKIFLENVEKEKKRDEEEEEREMERRKEGKQKEKEKEKDLLPVDVATPPFRRGSILRTPSPVSSPKSYFSTAGRRVSWSSSGPQQALIKDDGTLDIPAEQRVKQTAVKTPTRFFEEVEDGSEEEIEEGELTPKPPAETEEEHKKRVRELMFGRGGGAGRGGSGLF